jgi:hypothetical protein
MNNLKIKTLEKNLKLLTQQATHYRNCRNKAKTDREKKAWQTIIDLADGSKIDIRNEIKKAKGIGLKAPATKGLRKLCAKTFNVTGLRKKNGTAKKGYIHKKGGKIVKVKKSKK